MLFIAAALAEELRVALDLCSARVEPGYPGVSVWKGSRNGKEIHFLKTGAGPNRSAVRLERLLACCKPSQILLAGYAGALDPSLKIGDLVVIRAASSFGEQESALTLEQTPLTGSWELGRSQELFQLGKNAGLRISLGETLTSPHIIGEPGQKRTLRRRFHADVIDMETAALARVSLSRGVPLSCVRAVTDEAADTFLAPFSYEPGSTLAGRGLRLLAAGSWPSRYGEWKERAATARESLRQFLTWYLDSSGPGES